MSRSVILRSVLLLAGAAVAVPAHAQTPLPTSSVTALIDGLFVPSIPFNPNRETLVSQAEYNRRQQDSRQGIAIGLSTALASFPLGASSAGFAYQFDPAIGLLQQKAGSFGGIFVDRAVTNGRGVFNVGIAYQHSSFGTLQGVDLKNQGFPTQSQLGIYSVPLATPSATLPAGFDVGDNWRSQLDVKSETFIFSGSYGVTERVDLGWAVPVASVRVQGRFVRDYDASRDYDAFPDVRPFYPNRAATVIQSAGTVEATGVGDVVVRGKYALGPVTRQVGMVVGELRLPTGNEENLLGAGKASLKLLVGGSQQFGAAAVNVNGGYTFGGLTDEVNFAAGTEYALLDGKRLTVSAEVVTQTLRDTVTSVGNLVSFDQLGNDPGALRRRVIVTYGFWNRGATTLARAAFGAKYNVATNLLLTGAGLFRLNDNGYQPKVAGFVGLEYTLVRK